jgi:hypothetical protein
MDESRLIFLLLDGVGVLGTFLVVIASAVTAFMLTKAKQGAAGGWLLVLARGGVWVVGLGYMVMSLFAADLGSDGMRVIALLLRVVTLVCYVGTLVAFLLMRPAKEVANG